MGMSREIDPRVNAYIDALPQWQADLCQRLREVIHAADPGIHETVKRKGQPCFEVEGNVCALLAAKDHVNLFVYDGVIVADPEGIDEPIPVESLTIMLRQIIANNRAGGWRKLKAAGLTTPPKQG